jgi:hypothetical protein
MTSRLRTSLLEPVCGHQHQRLLKNPQLYLDRQIVWCCFLFPIPISLTCPVVVNPRFWAIVSRRARSEVILGLYERCRVIFYSSDESLYMWFIILFIDLFIIVFIIFIYYFIYCYLLLFFIFYHFYYYYFILLELIA